MARVGRYLLGLAGAVAATGAIFGAFSEYWFYRLEGGPWQVELILTYGLFGYLFLLTLRLFQVRAFAGFFVAAGTFGFMVEGIPVPALYLNLPFSMVWTSLAWHALLTVSVGYCLYRRVMARSGPGPALALNALIGVALGVWNAYLWNVAEGPAPGGISFQWQPTGEFARQFLIGWGLFIGGHVLFDRFPPSANAPSRREFAAFLGLATLAFLLGVFAPFFPFSLVLPFLLLVSLASLGAGAATVRNNWLAAFFALRIAPGAYLFSLALPAMAIATYALIAAARLEWETNVLAAALTVPAAALYWLHALLRANRAGASGQGGADRGGAGRGGKRPEGAEQ